MSAREKKLRDMLGELIEWDAIMGFHEDRRWILARRLFEQTRDEGAPT